MLSQTTGVDRTANDRNQKTKSQRSGNTMTKVTTKIWAVLLAALMMVTVFGGLVMVTSSTTASAATPIEETMVVKKAKDGNWYAFNKKNNKINTKYTGIAKNNNGWWRVVKGKVNFKATGVFTNSYESTSTRTTP